MSSLLQGWSRFGRLVSLAVVVCFTGIGCGPKVTAQAPTAKRQPVAKAAAHSDSDAEQQATLHAANSDAAPGTTPGSKPVSRVSASEGAEAGSVATLLEQPTADTSGGHLARAEIQKVVSSAKSEVQRCYEEGIHRNAALTGTVAVRFVIGPDGRVKTVASYEPKTNLADPDVVQCVVAAIGVLRFPEPEGGSVSVVYPLRLAQAK